MRLNLKSGLVLIAFFAQGYPAFPLAAQELSPPADVPREVADMFGGDTGDGTVTFAPPEQSEPDKAPESAATLTGDRYIYTSLRVITSAASRGCGVSNWNCMTNLCKADLGQSAWRGWAGCWRDNSKYICYFECGQTRTAF